MKDKNLALAGVFQATELVRQAACHGTWSGYAATACLFHAAGAVVSDIAGHPMELNRADSTFMNHRGILYAGHRELADRIIEMHRRLADR